jgi:mRNA-degrading endonuclease YafQ of YafQ-DinJ toxin-antitoxin module
LKIYKTYFTPEFLSQAKKYRHFKNLLEQKTKLLSQNPYTHCKSELLVGELRGLRSARLTKSFRIIFAVCEECRGKYRTVVGCAPELCSKMDPKTIVFLTIGPHDEVYP